MELNENLCDKITSVRIVSADSYLRTPILGLDPCYSEFRGNEIKQVPIIRIFGTDSFGIKTCMHVHGVFPYIYIPYDGGENTDDADRLSYQLASSLDKAINISLGQTNSSTQHIFKIMLVKGIPFYGYHRYEHQFLKIFLYNPAFINRAANLLQNGAILNRVYQPHESHLPFILQFLIDYNLYGMSFLHVPKSIVKYRQQNSTIDESLPVNLRAEQILDKKIERMSVSKHEIDVIASFILNRLQIDLNTNSEHANPGIAFIWNDEKARRNKNGDKMPSLSGNQEIVSQQISSILTESETFHQEALDKKLDAIQLSSDGSFQFDLTLIHQSIEQNRKFNVNQFFQNAVYPSECSSTDHQSNRTLLNASCLVDHLNTKQQTESSSILNASNVVDLNGTQGSFDVNESIVDEDLIISLTQGNPSQKTHLSETLNEDELNMLEILEKLEEQNEFDEIIVEDGSLLAPLSQKQSSQTHRQSQIVSLVHGINDNDEKCADRSFYDDDSDDDLLNDFSLSMVECLPIADDGNHKSQETLPQLDGSYDVQSMHRAKRGRGDRSPSKRNAKKYTPLNITVKESPSKNTTNHEIPKLKIVKINNTENKTSTTNGFNGALDSIKENGHKNVIAENLNKSTQLKIADICKPVMVTLIRYANIETDCPGIKKISNGKHTNDDDDSIDEISASPSPPTTSIRRYPKRNRAPAVHFAVEQQRKTMQTKSNKIKTVESDFLDTYPTEWSKCDVSFRYDMEKKFFPEPGPSTINYYDGIDIPGYYEPLKPKTNKKRTKIQNDDAEDEFLVYSSSGSDSDDKRKKKQQRKRKTSPRQLIKTKRIKSLSLSATATPTTKAQINETIIEEEIDDDENGIMMKSFYTDSPGIMAIESPNSTSKILPMIDSPDIDVSKIVKHIQIPSQLTNETQTNTNYKLILSKNPPSRIEAKKLIDSNEIPKLIHRQPYYSDSNDINKSNKLEIGHTVLKLHGNSLNDCEEFKSHLNVVGLYAWRKLNASNAIFPANGKKSLNLNNDRIRSILASDRKKKIEPNLLSPTFNDAKLWYERFKRLNGQPIQTNGLNAITETIIIDDSDDERNSTIAQLLKRSLDDRSKISAVDDDDSSDDVICLDDMNDTVDHSNRYKVSILSSSSAAATATTTNSCRPLSLRQELTKIANEYSNQSTENKQTEESISIDATITNTNTQNCSFGLTGVTFDNSFGFKMDLENFQCAKANIEHNYLTVLSMEIHVNTRQNLLPDPSRDAIICLFYSISNDVPDNSNQHSSGVFINLSGMKASNDFTFGLDICKEFVSNEIELLKRLVDLVKKWDPDIFVGYEIEMSSWGYLIQRCQSIGFDIIPLISRIPSQKMHKYKTRDDIDDAENENEIETDIKLYGRILLDVWRLLRGEIALTSYTFENIMYHILHRRYSLYSKAKLTRLWSQSVNRWIVIDYYLSRAKGTIEILNQLDLIGRTCELAKLFGIQFYEVLSRGSQFRVESMMLRIAKPKNLIPVSPSVQQRAHMRSPEYLALILEPHSRFYADPIIVLDFQSLYPSMIIAYNYCFSTCLGRVEHLGQQTPFEFGASQLRVPIKLIQKLNEKKLLHISPCGAVFVKSSVREGILPRMLREILDTRQMVKQSMKLHKTDKLLQRVLHSRQLGLKLMANVTYGYTAANFSGRMPCVEIGDSVVSKGRETLERAIKTVESNANWGCKVIYGDTDSLFVIVPNRSRSEAFRIGNEIAETITKENPYPVKLKLEKVYQPCILQTKKRYVGYMYESADQEKPVYEAKGIETVRRDGCPAVGKILEKSLRILFETCDVSAIKRYVCRQFTKILSGRASVQDLIFAKEFRGINGYKPTACVPALELTRISRSIDPRAEPRRGERVPYIIVNGSPGLPLIRLVRNPHELLTNEGLKINAMYYITKVIIPPLNRCLLLIGADAHQWFADLPRKSQYLLSLETPSNVLNVNANLESTMMTMATKKSTISQYFSTANCACDCGNRTQNGICKNCVLPERRQLSAIVLIDKSLRLERSHSLCTDICMSCCGQRVDTKCISLDCPVLFMLNRWQREIRQTDFYRQLLQENIHF